MRRTAVLLDEHPLWLDAVQRVLERVNVEVVARTTDPGDARALLDEHRPDVFLTELVQGDDETAAFVLISNALEHAPDLKVIVLSARSDATSVRRALMSGVVGYVLKTAHPDDLASAIRQAFEHSFYMAPRMSLSLIEPGGERAADDVPGSLTPREREILALAAEGHSNVRIARTLWVTEQTVKFHLSNVYRKLGVANRTEAGRWAQLHGLVEDARRARASS